MLDLYENLASQIKCPTDHLDLLKSIIPGKLVPILLYCSTWSTPKDIAKELGLPLEKIELDINKLFKDGMISRNKKYFKTRSFYGIINTLLGEGKLEQLANRDRAKIVDFYMQSRIQIYDRYIDQGRLKASSRVLTTGEALKHHEHLHAAGSSAIVTQDEAYNILNRANNYALVSCSCRLTFRNCHKPINTCINLNESANELLERGIGRQITLEECQEILTIADREGLVHIAISAPGQSDYALCSCCSCCCHDLQALLKYNRSNWVQKANVIVQDDPQKCINCFNCVERCVFGARKNINEQLVYNPELCYGCGLCITSCPAGAITLKKR
ncbi:4Fe-4S binding domain-containing protein [Desulfotomaculum arcticum]|uniref:4Fe-4S binding domain-containing protein n=1 Tax=Desulfotruncus arcticus DSM 17038 TaxID=1121424 RepID=A0A1I2U097_9FIRM|nr:4Fe-4S binding protein [Desulfotruncus arcticus]SFG69849.1 4Fe-4S binding domain-containing protein [Desulfotomaculum arcticum] [Desulfotruncus arcticus DSM 17038]